MKLSEIVQILEKVEDFRKVNTGNAYDSESWRLICNELKKIIDRKLRSKSRY